MRERREVREPPEPLIIIRDNGGNLGLLEHEFGDEDGVGIASLTPRELAAVLMVPIRQGRVELIFLERHR